MAIKTPYQTKRKIEAKIGHLCGVWASLDCAANLLLAEILGCSDDQAKCVATQLEPVASRVKLLKNLTYTTNTPERWRSCLMNLLNIIDGELCPKRNRIIHDAWDLTDVHPVQLDRRAKIARPQSRQEPLLITEARSLVSADYIDSLIKRVSVATVGLMVAHADLVISREDGLPVPELTALEVAVNTVMPERPLIPLSVQPARPPVRGG